MVHEHQAKYYQAINTSTQQTDSAPFIEFMLGVILETIKSSTANDSPQVSPQVIKLLSVLNISGVSLNRNELKQALRLNDRKSFRERYVKPASDAGLLRITIPDKPNSRLQKYALTDRGKNVAKTLE